MKKFLIFTLILGSIQVFGAEVTIFETEDIFLKDKFCNEEKNEKCFKPGEVIDTLESLLAKRGYQNVSCIRHSDFFSDYGVTCKYEKPLVEAGKCYLEDREVSGSERALKSPVESVLLSLITGVAVISETVRLDLMTITQFLDEDNEYFDESRDPFKFSRASAAMLRGKAKSVATGKLKIPMSCDAQFAKNYDHNKEIDRSEINLKDNFGKIYQGKEESTGALQF